MIKSNLVGRKFGRLTVLKDDGTRDNKKKVKWLCQCDCGKTCHVIGAHLKNGSTRSCGCLNDEMRHQRYKDLTGFEDENFKVINKSHSDNGRVYWKCICKHCGKEVIFHSNQIQQCNSCGCKRGANKAYMDSIRDIESLKSTKPTAKSSTGVRGVYYQKSKNRYIAVINVDKRQKYLGGSKSFEEAVKLRKDAEKKYWGV